MINTLLALDSRSSMEGCSSRKTADRSHHLPDNVLIFTSRFNLWIQHDDRFEKIHEMYKTQPPISVWLTSLI